MAIVLKKNRKPKAWKEVISEVMKWVLVLFLLWPMITFQLGRFYIVRILIGIALFIIFSGKLMYDYLIKDYLKQRSLSVKKDIINFLGIIFSAALVVGVVLFMFALFIIQFAVLNNPKQ